MIRSATPRQFALSKPNFVCSTRLSVNQPHVEIDRRDRIDREGSDIRNSTLVQDLLELQLRYPASEQGRCARYVRRNILRRSACFDLQRTRQDRNIVGSAHVIAFDDACGQRERMNRVATRDSTLVVGEKPAGAFGGAKPSGFFPSHAHRNVAMTSQDARRHTFTVLFRIRYVTKQAADGCTEFSDPIRAGSFSRAPRYQRMSPCQAQAGCRYPSCVEPAYSLTTTFARVEL
jgi:hypothetical protein